MELKPAPKVTLPVRCSSSEITKSLRFGTGVGRGVVGGEGDGAIDGDPRALEVAPLAGERLGERGVRRREVGEEVDGEAEHARRRLVGVRGEDLGAELVEQAPLRAPLRGACRGRGDGRQPGRERTRGRRAGARRAGEDAQDEGEAPHAASIPRGPRCATRRRVRD